MTCIVGLVDKDKVWIGGDSAASSQNQIVIIKDPKVFKRGNFIIGCAGSFRTMQILKYIFKFPKLKSNDLYKYLCRDFAKEMKKASKDLMSDNEGSKFGSFLIGHENRLFTFDDDLQVIENLNGLDSVGSGCDYALGSIITTIGQDPKKRILKALEASSFYCPSVAAPFHVIST